MQAPVHVRWCPNCEEEFRPEIARCSDCGGPLVDRLLGEDGQPLHPDPPVAATPGTAAPPALPPDFRELTHANSPADLRPITNTLDEAGIEFHAVFAPDPPGQARNALGGRFIVSVHESERIRAIQAIAPHLGLEAGLGDTLAVERAFDATAGYVQCPACGADVTPGSQTCGECGLVLGDASEGSPADES